MEFPKTAPAGAVFVDACCAGVDIFIQQVINGLTLGAVYAMVALGYTMVYGIIQLINFAHGEVVMIGAMVAFSVIGALAPSGLPPLAIVLVAAGCAIPVCMLIGYAMERAAYQSEEHTSELQSLRHLVCRLLLEKKKKQTKNKDQSINTKTNQNI